MRRPRWLSVSNARLTFLFAFGVWGVVIEMRQPSPSPALIALFGGCLGFPFVVRSRGTEDTEEREDGHHGKTKRKKSQPVIEPSLDLEDDG